MTTLREKTPRDSISPGSLKWDNTPTLLSTRRKNDPPKGVENKTIIFPLVLDLTDKDAKDKGTIDSDDNKPLSWNMYKQSVLTTAKMPSKEAKTHRTRLSSTKLMEDALVENKCNTKKKRSLKKRVVAEVRCLLRKLWL